MTLDKNTRLKQQNQNVHSYLCIISYLKILLPNQGLLYFMKTRIPYFLKKIEQYEITKGQNKRETRLNQRKIFKKEKTLTFLEKDTNLGATIAPKKGLIGSANRTWVLPKPTKLFEKQLFNLTGHFVRKMVPNLISKFIPHI